MIHQILAEIRSPYFGYRGIIEDDKNTMQIYEKEDKVINVIRKPLNRNFNEDQKFKLNLNDFRRYAYPKKDKQSDEGIKQWAKQ